MTQHPLERLTSIVLEDDTIRYRAPEAASERETAIADLLAANAFAPRCMEPCGPYHLHLGIRDNRLYFTIESEKLDAPREVVLPIAPFRRIIKDYFLIFESHLEAVQTAQSHRIEAIDMARRSIHNEGAERLSEQLQDRISLDFDTARRLFTLICVLHIK